MKKQFGIRFDLRNPRTPGTVEQATVYVRMWAKHEDVDIPEGLEPEVVDHELDPHDSRKYATLYVGFRWDDTEPSSPRQAGVAPDVAAD